MFRIERRRWVPELLALNTLASGEEVLYHRLKVRAPHFGRITIHARVSAGFKGAPPMALVAAALTEVRAFGPAHSAGDYPPFRVMSQIKL